MINKKVFLISTLSLSLFLFCSCSNSENKTLNVVENDIEEQSDLEKEEIEKVFLNEKKEFKIKNDDIKLEKNRTLNESAIMTLDTLYSLIELLQNEREKTYKKNENKSGFNYLKSPEIQNTAFKNTRILLGFVELKAKDKANENSKELNNILKPLYYDADSIVENLTTLYKNNNDSDTIKSEFYSSMNDLNELINSFNEIYDKAYTLANKL